MCCMLQESCTTTYCFVSCEHAVTILVLYVFCTMAHALMHESTEQLRECMGCSHKRLSRAHLEHSSWAQVQPLNAEHKSNLAC